MKLGISMPCRTAPLRQIPEYARRAEEAGLDTVWAWENVSDPFSMLATSSMVTERIGIGTALAVAPNRTASAMANHAADIDQMSAGRMHLGVGPGLIPNGKPLTYLSEYIDVLRLHWQYIATGEAPTYEGEFHSYKQPRFEVFGRRPLERPTMPVYLGAIGPKMLRLVGEKADGWIGSLSTPAYIKEHVRPILQEGAEFAGRSLSDVDILDLVFCSVSDDEELAWKRARQQVGFYVLAKHSDTPVKFLNKYDEVTAIRERARTDGAPAAYELLSEELIRAFALVGTPDQARSQLTQWEGAVDHLVLHTPYVPPLTHEDAEDCYANALATFGRTTQIASAAAVR